MFNKYMLISKLKKAHLIGPFPKQHSYAIHYHTFIDDSIHLLEIGNCSDENTFNRPFDKLAQRNIIILIWLIGLSIDIYWYNAAMTNIIY